MGPSDGITSELSRKPRWSTPATVYGLPLSTMVFPTMPGSELNNRFQTRSLRIATSPAPGLSSSGNNKRPRSGFSPNNFQKPEDAWCRTEEHTSELQLHLYHESHLLLQKKNPRR